jgi:hypothetical protein
LEIIKTMKKIDLVVKISENAFFYESKRSEKIVSTAEKYMTAVALIIGFHLIEISPISLSKNYSGGCMKLITTWLSLIAFLVLGTSMILSFFSMTVKNFLSFPRGTKLLDEINNNRISSSIANIKVALMYLEAYEINANINDKRAKLLLLSGIFLILGFIIAVINFLILKIY